jgi:hypothetical protein
MAAEQPPVGTLAARARQARRMEVVLKPGNTPGIVEQFGHRKVNC